MKRTSRIALASATAVLSFGLINPVATATADHAPATSQGELVENRAKAAFRGAVAPSECGPTLLDAYVDQLIEGMTAEQLSFVVAHQDTLFDVPTYDALFFGTTGDADYALDSHARQLQNAFRDLRRFWTDVDTGEIQLMAMSGDALLDRERIVKTLTAMVEFGVIAPMTAAEIEEEAQVVSAFMQEERTFHDNPLWTLNAFAFSGEGDPDPAIEALPDKLVFGDGIIEAYDAIGLGDVGPRVIMAHEYAHHVQYELGSFDSGPADPSEATRRTELMADAMATYSATHKKGFTLNKKRVVEAMVSFYTVGDCSFTSPGHHGTPLQRQRASAWGADLASSARPASRVLPAKTVADQFDAALPGIIAGS